MKWKNIRATGWLEIDFPNEDDESFPGADGCGPLPDYVTIQFDILAFSSEFELNAIPTASASVAIGRRVDDLTHVAPIHEWIDQIQLQLPCRVWLWICSTDGSNPGIDTDEWPADAFKVFEGYVTGSSYRIGTTGAEIVIQMTHWLTDLNFSSALSRQSHPLNPAQYFFTANAIVDTALSGGALFFTGPNLVGTGLAATYFQPITITTDFWGGSKQKNVSNVPIYDGLKYWLLFLTAQDRINSRQILAEGGANTFNQNLNWEACRALKRFEPNAKTPLVTETGYVLGVPLAMSQNPDSIYYIANGINKEIGKESLSDYTNVTLWDKLAGEFHANYMYSVVPLVDKALVVPFVPGLKKNGNDLVHRTIMSSEYELIDMQAMIPRPLRAVGVMMSLNYEAGSGQAKDQSAPYGTFGGYFDKYLASSSTDTRYKDGLVMIKQGPIWLSSFYPKYQNTAMSVGVSSALATAVGTAVGVVEAVTRRSIYLKAKPVWDQYAKTLYLHEVLKNRQMVINGPLRFDIAPGSTVKIEFAEDKYVKAIRLGPQADQCDETSYTYKWCSVLRVSNTVDCQNMRASTSFHLGHHRSDKESDDVSLSTDRHPLWQGNQWGGCAMVQDPAFAPLTTKT